MNVFIYGSYVSSDRERLEERISEDIACNVKNIASVEALSESAYDDIEEIHCSCKGLIDLMKQAYIFIEYCGVDNV